MQNEAVIQPIEEQWQICAPMLQCVSIRRALVVDDSMLIRHTVCPLLEKYGFEVESASNGLYALRVFSRFRPSVIFTDLEMPKMNVHQLICSLKSKSETFDIPISILSAKRSPDEPRADVCMKKDADIHAELLKVLELTLTPAKHTHRVPSGREASADT